MATYEQERTKRQKEIDEKILKRVQRGLKWLEKTHGPGWEDKIDLETLNLASADRCVLGQVYADKAPLHSDEWGDPYGSGYSYACGELFGIKDDPDGVKEGQLSQRRGFSTRSHRDSWEDLDEAWRYVLEPRVRR